MDILSDKLAKNKKQNSDTTISKIISSINSKYQKRHGKKIFAKKTRETASCDSLYVILNFPE